MALAHIITIEDHDWLDLAACRGTDPGLFFPDGTTTPEAQEKAMEAKSVCIECKSRVECLEYALKTNQDTGIWGGTTEQERKKIKRELKNRRRF